VGEGGGDWVAMGSEWSGWEEAGAHRARKASRRRSVARSGGVLVGFLLVILTGCSMIQEPNLLGKTREIPWAR